MLEPRVEAHTHPLCRCCLNVSRMTHPPPPFPPCTPAQPTSTTSLRGLATSIPLASRTASSRVPCPTSRPAARWCLKPRSRRCAANLLLGGIHSAFQNYLQQAADGAAPAAGRNTPCARTATASPPCLHPALAQLPPCAGRRGARAALSAGRRLVGRQPDCRPGCTPAHVQPRARCSWVRARAAEGRSPGAGRRWWLRGGTLASLLR